MAQRSRDLVKRADLAARDGGNLQESPERDAEMRDLIKAQIMPHRTDKNGNDLGPATDAETDLMLAEAASMGLSILAGQAKPIRFEKGGPATLQPTWIGLVKQAQDTGEFGGIECILYTDGTRTTVTDSWGNARVDHVWQDGWDDPEVAPIACKVGIWRKGAPRPSWGLAHYSTWGTEPDPDGWHDKIGADGQPVRRKKRGSNEYYKVREHNGKRVPKASDWWKMPKAIHMLAVAALRLALKATFQPDLFRRATMSAATELGLDRDERLEVAQQITGRPVETFSELDPSEYTEVYDALVARGRADVPAEAEVVVETNVVGAVAGQGPPQGDFPAAAPDDPEELAALQKKGIDEFRRLSSMLPAEWRPWFRSNVEEIKPGAWEGSDAGTSWPRSFNVAQMKELFKRLDQVRPWGDPERVEQ
jgi:RecT family